MSDEIKPSEEWHVQHHARGFRSIFSTEEEARANAGAGDTVTKFVKEDPIPAADDDEADETPA